MKNQNVEDSEAVKQILAYARQYGLEIEVVLWAMYAIQANPTITIRQAMLEGYNEWVK